MQLVFLQAAGDPEPTEDVPTSLEVDTACALSEGRLRTAHTVPWKSSVRSIFSPLVFRKWR